MSGYEFEETVLNASKKASVIRAYSKGKAAPVSTVWYSYEKGIKRIEFNYSFLGELWEEEIKACRNYRIRYDSFPEN